MCISFQGRGYLEAQLPGNGCHIQVWVVWLRNPLKFAGTLSWDGPEPKSCQEIIHSSSWQKQPRFKCKALLPWEFR